MPNIAGVLKEEIRRLARKEIRAEMSTTKRAASAHRREIARLKKMIQAQSKKLARLEAGDHAASNGAEVDDPMDGTRFSARSVRSQRRRLKLSAEEFAKLIGVSTQTIYLWEQGKTRARRSQMPGLVAVRGMGRREALGKLSDLGVEPKRRRRRRIPR